ncbi:hypothetical protein BDN72DRAFT_905465 [Pluteus cervinus]|uniref:Uncharacterized protein n=1 Tax=Pluteus cervinus TaxID=181527 RepID=A0ACD3A216_9AGAR|nr:hypothetical protein BDN72DRAFT_905465 [Pluteus cervinus]
MPKKNTTFRPLSKQTHLISPYAYSPTSPLSLSTPPLPPVDPPKQNLTHKFAKDQRTWVIKTLYPSFINHFSLPDKNGNLPRKDITKRNWIMAEIVPQFSAKYFSEMGPPNQAAYEESLYKMLTNHAGTETRQGLREMPVKKAQTQRRRVNAQQLYAHDNAETITDRMNQKIKADGLTSHDNLPVRNTIVRELFSKVSDEERQVYEERASTKNAKLTLPPTEEDIMANHALLESDIEHFFDNMLGTDEHHKHGNGAMLVVGEFNHGDERFPVCLMGLSGKPKHPFVLPKEVRKPLLSAVRQYLDIHHPLSQRDNTDIPPSDVIMSDASLEAMTPSSLDVAVTLPAAAPSAASLDNGRLTSSLDVATTLPAAPSAESLDNAGFALATKVADLSISPPIATPAATTGPLTREVITAALEAVFSASATTETVQPSSTSTPTETVGLDSIGEDHDVVDEDFVMVELTPDMARADETLSSKVALPVTRRGRAPKKSIINTSSAVDINSDSTAANENELRRSSRFGKNYSHRVINSMKKRE